MESSVTKVGSHIGEFFPLAQIGGYLEELNQQKAFAFRRFEWAYADLEHRDIMEISEETGCEKPCKYRKYRLIGGPLNIFDKSTTPQIQDFGLWAFTNYTTVGTTYFNL